MYSYVTNLFAYNLYITVWVFMYSYVTRMLLVCYSYVTRMYSSVLVYYSYVRTRLYSYDTRMVEQSINSEE